MPIPSPSLTEVTIPSDNQFQQLDPIRRPHYPARTQLNWNHILDSYIISPHPGFYQEHGPCTTFIKSILHAVIRPPEYCSEQVWSKGRRKRHAHGESTEVQKTCLKSDTSSSTSTQENAVDRTRIKNSNQVFWKQPYFTKTALEDSTF